ncbi:thioesterase family protein [Sphingomonas canadensis]|uniref:Thioesterase family protein n=1 Tax=Sphingomonas canadensis TaxID=1219257 RepID=A0ABW3H6J6_9SPHN|nr:thioesterase family protein [Sphingomonas canadensis]MCW3836761.1 thioesterase family protein [Sphingomonas canadensis]
MTALADILAAADPLEGGFRAEVPEGWRQGRTTYGGLSSALALHAALAAEPDLPPLRSAQVAFIGPLSGAVTVTATRLRRGRNAAFIQADVASEAGLGLRAAFVFMAPMASAITHDTAPRLDHRPPGEGAKIHSGPADFFTGNFDLFNPAAETQPAEWLRWVRLRERDGLHPMVELMAIGDALPPAAYKLIAGQKAPLSSLNWMINLVAAEPATRDGWWLLGAGAEMARDGFSSQRMAIWNADGEPVAEAMQGVAIFG